MRKLDQGDMNCCMGESMPCDGTSMGELMNPGVSIGVTMGVDTSGVCTCSVEDGDTPTC